MTIPPPFIRSRGSRKAYYELVEPYDAGGRIAYRYHDLSRTSNPRVALERGEEAQRERIAWAGDAPKGETARLIAKTRARLDALALAIEKFEAAWIDGWSPDLAENPPHSSSGGSGETGSQG